MAAANGFSRLVVGQGLRLAVAGVVFGLLGAFAATRLLEGLLFEVRRTDATTFVVVASALLAAAYLAADLPARRASRVDPVIALRDD